MDGKIVLFKNKANFCSLLYIKRISNTIAKPNRCFGACVVALGDKIAIAYGCSLDDE
ncbi:hypothetical protein IQ264_00940 [Phormidium sp. LEGE 05292]|uniref:hypothetical protein n=1 Tax=[Phormidium] sp. LEGE 05292 TaxID=767427 RepID=UPI00187EDE51|nr:hypothetical protein [Phormidium sp. LEGE 05292]MBE9224041.1 hypothetical protein [Phormidium sp. LEGE 05292]